MQKKWHWRHAPIIHSTDRVWTKVQSSTRSEAITITRCGHQVTYSRMIKVYVSTKAAEQNTEE